MRNRYNFDLKVYELPHKNPSSLKESEENKNLIPLDSEFPNFVVRAGQLDKALKLAKEHIISKGKEIRSCSVSNKGTIVAVVYSKKDTNFPKPLLFESRVKTVAKPRIRRRRKVK